MKLCLLLKKEKLRGTALHVQEIFPVVIALWFHLFPFRTEKLSTVAPMVLHTRGRVGRRHFTRGLREIEDLSFYIYIRAHGNMP